MLNRIRPDLVGMGLAALAAVLLTVCALAGVEPPSFLAELGLIALGGGVGASLPRGSATAPAATPEPPTYVAQNFPPATPGRFDQPPPPLPRRYADDTGVFSRVTE